MSELASDRRPEPFARVDRNGLLVLDAAESLRLLAPTTFGRIAVTIGALPVIIPVNFRLVDDRIVFRTNPGSKLDAATSGAVVCFEVDHVDPVSHAGWSVIVTGIASEVTDPDDLARIAEANVPRWANGGGDRVVQIPISMISGRVLVPGLSWDDHRWEVAEVASVHLGIHLHPHLPFG